MITKHKKASIYIFALAAALVLVSLVVGLSAIIMQFRRSSRTNTQIDRAKIYAELGIRHALYFTSIEPNWRSMLVNGIWLQDIPVDNATYTVTGIDPDDGSLIVGDEFIVELTCTAKINLTQQTLSVLTQNHPSELLKYAVAAGGLLKIGNNAVINGDASTNDQIDKSADSIIVGNAEAVGIIDKQDNINGIIAPGSDSKSFPDDQAIIDYYLNHATPIPFIDKIDNVLLTPTINPLGPANPDGIYSINCANEKIEFNNCRIIATIILINPKNDSFIGEAINWQPARPHLPALIIDGFIEIKPNKDFIEEADVKVDLNLPQEPGFGSIAAVYPNIITGTIFSRGDLKISNDTNILGPVIVTGILEIKDNTIITADSQFFDIPPKMFMDSRLELIPHTWR